MLLPEGIPQTSAMVIRNIPICILSLTTEQADMLPAIKNNDSIIRVNQQQVISNLELNQSYPKGNLIFIAVKYRVAGEYWGVFVGTEEISKDFTEEFISKVRREKHMYILLMEVEDSELIEREPQELLCRQPIAIFYWRGNPTALEFKELNEKLKNFLL